MLRLRRLGESKKAISLAELFRTLTPTQGLEPSAVVLSFLEGLTSTAASTDTDAVILSALPACLWPPIPPDRLCDLLTDVTLRTCGALPNAPTRLRTCDELLALAEPGLITNTVRAALARRYRGPRERAWNLGAEIASLHGMLGSQHATPMIERILNALEMARQRYLRSHGFPCCIPPIKSACA